MKYVDPDGRVQNIAQKIFTRGLSYISEHSQKAKDFIKSQTSIDVQRNSEDNGNNGKYYKSNASVKFLGIPLNKVPVQSTADHPKLNNGEKKYEGGTPPEKNPSQSWCAGDKIKINIKDPVPEE